MNNRIRIDWCRMIIIIVMIVFWVLLFLGVDLWCKIYWVIIMCLKWFMVGIYIVS